MTMVQANELRQGNWVLFNGKPEVVDVNIAKPLYSSALTEGIPITQEILGRAGFELPCKVKFLNNDWFICVESTGVYIQVEKNDAFDYGICERLEVGKIEYVHQLQNLYFCLTGEELEINL